MERKKRIWFILLLAFCLGFVVLIVNPEIRNGFLSFDNSLFSERANEDLFYKRVEKQRSCVLEKILKRGSIWAHLHIIINSCAVNNKLSYMKFLKLKTDKMFIEFLKPKQHKCVSVTLGIGNETIMERSLKQIYPNCRLYGADPFEEVGKAFKPYGELFTLATDDRAAQMQLNLMGKSGRYEPHTATTVPLGMFLHDYVKQPVVHYLSMDVEGSEYRLMPYLTKDGNFGLDSRQAVVICQITLELHGYLEKRGMSDGDFEKLLIHFISRSPYVPLSAFLPGNHHRIYLYNAEAPQCRGIFNLYSS